MEMRDIILRLRERGATVFFSSHILNDIEQICDKVAIIQTGRLYALGTLDELLDSDRVSTEITVRGLSDAEGLAAELEGVRVEKLGAGHRVFVEEAQTNNALRAILQRAGQVETVTRNRETLEDLFVRAALRGGSDDDDAPEGEEA